MEKRTKTLVTAGLMVGVLAAALDTTIVDTAFPKMITELGGVLIFTWVITAYLLASTAVAPVVGKLADIFGRKSLYLIGLVLFVGGSGLCGAAHSMNQLIAFRSMQGIGAGMLMPIALTIVGDLYPGPERAKMQAVFSGMWGLASVLGPKLGGWITHHYTWRWVFYVNLPIGIAAFLLILFSLKESTGARRPVDYWGSLTVTGGITLLMLGLLQGGQDFPWNSWQIISYFAGAALLLAAFIVIEQRVPEPVLDFHLFRNRTYSVMGIVGLLFGACMFGCIIFVPWFIQGVVGVNPDVAGNVMTPMMFSVMVFSIVAGRLALKIRYSWLIGAGLTLMAAGFLTMTGWTPATTQLQATLATMVFGAGLGCVLPTLTLAVQNAFPAHYRGQVTSGITFFRSIGNTLGASVFGVIFNNQMAARFPAALASLKPTLERLSPVSVKVFEGFSEHPQGLLQVLLKAEIRANIPAPVREPILMAIKEMTVGSLHTVYWTGVVVSAAALVFCQFLGKASLATQAKEATARGEEIHSESTLVME